MSTVATQEFCSETVEFFSLPLKNATGGGRQVFTFAYTSRHRLLKRVQGEGNKLGMLREDLVRPSVRPSEDLVDPEAQKKGK
jgi:hypothetical protein